MPRSKQHSSSSRNSRLRSVSSINSRSRSRSDSRSSRSESYDRKRKSSYQSDSSKSYSRHKHSKHQKKDRKYRKRSSSSSRHRDSHRQKSSRMDRYNDRKYGDRDRYRERSSDRDKDRYNNDRRWGDNNFSRQNNFFPRPQNQFTFQPHNQQVPTEQIARPPPVFDLEPFKKKFITENDPIHKKSRTDVKDYRKKHDIIIRSDPSAVPNPIFNFSELSQVSRNVMDEIIKAGFTSPTPIQSQAFTIAMNGDDMIGIAQTGSGKTLAFLLPAIVHIAAQKPITPQDGPIALILTPTRELTLQIMGQFQKFASKSGYTAACLYGGQDKHIQRSQLRYGVHIIIACPGRLIDFIDSYYTTLSRVTFLVLDEADRMLDMGFEPQIRRILGQIRPDRQTLLFSATWPKEVQKLALDFCDKNKVHIQIGELDLTTNKHIKQKIHVLRSEDKKRKLLSILSELPRDCKAIIFCATKKGCEGLSHQLTREGFRCISIHGDKSQKERDFAMDTFKDNRVKLLIATDVASRGLDVRDITYVINFDMPKMIEDYVHRIGRTGRAGAHGIAITFFATDEDIRLARDLIDVLKRGDQEVPEDLYKASYMKKPPGPKPIPKKIQAPQTQQKWEDPKYQQYLHYMNQPPLDPVITVQAYTQQPQPYVRPAFSGFSNGFSQPSGFSQPNGFSSTNGFSQPPPFPTILNMILTPQIPIQQTPESNK